MPLFFIRSNDVKKNILTVSGELLNHIKNALRYSIGDLIKVVDENKISYHARISRFTDRSLEATVTYQEPPPAPSFPPLILAQALVKKKKMESLLEKAGELGVSEIIPLITERTVIQPHEERWDHQRKRWEGILLEAAQQSEQLSPPKIHPPIDFQSFLRIPKPGIGLVFFEEEILPFRNIFSAHSSFVSTDPITLIIGPEGGFKENEIELCREKGYISVSLGQRKLRSETAVMVAITLLQYELGYFGQ